MREKVRFVREEMERPEGARLRLAGRHSHAAHRAGHRALVGEEYLQKGAAPRPLVALTRPPVVGLEFEMDFRGAAREIVL